jgi:hypothetical protein
MTIAGNGYDEGKYKILTMKLEVYTVVHIHRVKIKLSLHVTKYYTMKMYPLLKHHAMKMYRRVEV